LGQQAVGGDLDVAAMVGPGVLAGARVGAAGLEVAHETAPGLPVESVDAAAEEQRARAEYQTHGLRPAEGPFHRHELAGGPVTLDQLPDVGSEPVAVRGSHALAHQRVPFEEGVEDPVHDAIGALVALLARALARAERGSVLAVDGLGGRVEERAPDGYYRVDHAISRACFFMAGAFQAP
jgi:hypothetical protein